MFRIISVFSVVVSLVTSSHAGVSDSMMHFFKHMGASSNVSSAGAYKDQSAGFFTGGNLFVRNTVHNANLASIKTPGYRAGCGGIDMHLGAMSFISAQELVRALRTVGSNAASYAMLLAIETFSPQIKNIVTELNDLAQKINQSNINSCEIAATTMGAMLPKSEVANRHLCTMIGTDGSYGGFSDYASAKQGCGAGGDRSKALRAGRGNPKYQHMLGEDFNLAWEAIQQNEFLRADRRLAEFFMSLSGTIIAVVEGDDRRVQMKTSLATKSSVLKALMQGGAAHIYRCNDEKCLSVTYEEVDIPAGAAFVEKVKEMFQSIEHKILEDAPLSDEEVAFINSMSLPFYKALNDLVVYRKGGAPMDVAAFSDIAAADIIYHYIIEILDVVEESLSNLRKAQVDDTYIKDFTKALYEARGRVNQERMSNYKQLEKVFGFINHLKMNTKNVAAKYGLLEGER